MSIWAGEKKVSKTISKIGGTCRNIQGPGGVVFGEFFPYLNLGKSLWTHLFTACHFCHTVMHFTTFGLPIQILVILSRYPHLWGCYHSPFCVPAPWVTKYSLPFFWEYHFCTPVAICLDLALTRFQSPYILDFIAFSHLTHFALPQITLINVMSMWWKRKQWQLQFPLDLYSDTNITMNYDAAATSSNQIW